MLPLILGSTSPFRRSLLEKLGLPFSTASPATDERPHPGETAQALAERLAIAKARDVGARHPAALVIGSDQVASLDGDIIGKPGDRERAIAQLSGLSGRSVAFHTGLCLLNTGSGRCQSMVDTTWVHFRSLSQDQIVRYIDREQPFGCAGSFKSEGFGITLFNALDGRDPNSLIGLPLIELTTMLLNEGIALP